MVVHHDAQRLSQNYRCPHHQIAEARTPTKFHVARHVRQRHLAHHAHERPDLEHFQRHTDQILVEECAEQEDDQRGHCFAVSLVDDWDVEVAHAPSVNGHIPGTPKRVDVVRVPPVTVEITIGKMQEFTNQIEERVEGQIEEAQPGEVVGDLGDYA